ncbi:MAG: hypothetical protein HQ518_10315 [Rhodopirellula sp.]|nr:hypothetical protein [Rhodopirellula sp.]
MVTRISHHGRLMFLLAVSVLLLVTQTAFATPYSHSWVRVTPLGVNAQSCFYLQMEYRNTGSHYRYTETVALIRCDTSNHEIKDRITLRETVYEDTTTLNDWNSREVVTTSLDLPAYLRQHRVELVFPEPVPQNWKLLNGEIVEIQSDGKPVVRLSKQSLRMHPAGFKFKVQQPADSAARLQIVSSFSTFVRDGKKAIEGRLLILQEGQTTGESDFDQTLLFAPLSR